MLDFQPQVALEDGLRLTSDWLHEKNGI
jgi:hypothetical protein